MKRILCVYAQYINIIVYKVTHIIDHEYLIGPPFLVDQQLFKSSHSDVDKKPQAQKGLLHFKRFATHKIKRVKSQTTKTL